MIFRQIFPDAELAVTVELTEMPTSVTSSPDQIKRWLLHFHLLSTKQWEESGASIIDLQIEEEFQMELPVVKLLLNHVY